MVVGCWQAFSRCNKALRARAAHAAPGLFLSSGRRDGRNRAGGRTKRLWTHRLTAVGAIRCVAQRGVLKRWMWPFFHSHGKQLCLQQPRVLRVLQSPFAIHHGLAARAPLQHQQSTEHCLAFWRQKPGKGTGTQQRAVGPTHHPGCCCRRRIGGAFSGHLGAETPSRQQQPHEQALLTRRCVHLHVLRCKGREWRAVWRRIPVSEPMRQKGRRPSLSGQRHEEFGHGWGGQCHGL